MDGLQHLVTCVRLLKNIPDGTVARWSRNDVRCCFTWKILNEQKSQLHIMSLEWVVAPYEVPPMSKMANFSSTVFLKLGCTKKT